MNDNQTLPHEPYATRETHVGSRQLRAALADHLKRVGDGESLVITVNGQPAARLAPLTSSPMATLDDLAGAGLIRLAEARHRISEHPLAFPFDTAPGRTLTEVRGR